MANFSNECISGVVRKILGSDYALTAKEEDGNSAIDTIEQIKLIESLRDQFI